MTVGEVVTRGNVVLEGYWRQPEETASTVINDGWFHTGDPAPGTASVQSTSSIARRT
ncbi:MAG: AMP-binding protein [Dehalococcoidia bacterium]